MTTPNPRGPQPAGVSAVLALVLAVISFFALAILGLGVLSTVTDADIIATPGLGQAPGAIGMLAAVLAFAAALWSALQQQKPSFLSAPLIGLVTALVHLIGVWVTALFEIGDVVVATAVAGALVRGGASAVMLLVALVAGWGGIALRRTRAEHPRWPWERDEES